MQLCGSLSILWHCLSLGDVSENWPLQSCGHCWVFQICWHIECSTFTASSFRIWNSSAGNPSLPLALFIVTLPKAHLASHSRMFGSRWVTTPSWLSVHLRPFLYSSVCYCHLFLVSSASAGSLLFLSSLDPIQIRVTILLYTDFQSLHVSPFLEAICCIHWFYISLLWGWCFPRLNIRFKKEHDPGFQNSPEAKVNPRIRW